MGQKFEIFIMLQKCESSTVVTHEFALFFCTIANNFSCGESKTGYFVKFGIAPYVKDELIESVSIEPYFILVDESLNKAIKSKQLDITFDIGTKHTTGGVLLLYIAIPWPDESNRSFASQTSILSLLNCLMQNRKAFTTKKCL